MLGTDTINCTHPPAEPIMTAEYADFDAFWAKVQETWDRQWQTVFGAAWEGVLH